MNYPFWAVRTMELTELDLSELSCSGSNQPYIEMDFGAKFLSDCAQPPGSKNDLSLHVHVDSVPAHVYDLIKDTLENTS